MKHDDLLEAAKDAATEIFNDTSVSQADTRISLEDLIAHIKTMIRTLDD